ncbi:triose-phosphate isomerase [Methylobacterium currus]|uniref:Triosephosphate isomerase n=1 Tax=Methylobacterium currus TaxID=2051553 RepID=A0A2R4WF78_9HYPH|nr:triose-phosphate isomerase [Methylobacterium currus]AWB20181.1 triose-phosphate isomerase [Methylobacterium currus]UHC15077.1 triose-phosphate isomerase [Methylobacterium currus]
MTTERPRPLVAGNWKMNGLRASLAVAEAVRDGLDAGLAQRIDVLVCPPATLVGAAAAALKGSAVQVGGQDVHDEASGAYTGDVSAEMLADLGATYTIVGHSERRARHHESDAEIRAKALAARRAGLKAIICVGETRAEREAGRTLEVVRGQLAGSLPDGATAADTVIAYEPVWAIGTGLTPTVDDVAAVHALIRQELASRLGAEGAKVRILYGGSVKPSNAAELMGVANVDGALVGGASLKAEDFLGIAAAYR